MALYYNIVVQNYGWYGGLAADTLYGYRSVISNSTTDTKKGWYFKLYFSNTKVTDLGWYEWTPGQTTFTWYHPGWAPDGLEIPKSCIFDIKTYNDELVELPEDSHGIFSNFINLGIDEDNELSWYASSSSSPWNPEDSLHEYVFDASKFDVSNVVDMSSMFENSFHTPYIGGYGWTPGNNKYIRMYWMNSKVTLKGINGWDTRKVKNMSRMFANINIANREYYNHDAFISNLVWNCDNLETAENMFAGSFFRLDKLTLIFKENKGVKLDNMFNNFINGNFGLVESTYTAQGVTYNLFKLYDIDLHDWVFNNASDISFISMFRNCKTSKIILGENFSTAVCTQSYAGNAVNYMFLFDSTLTAYYTKYSAFSSSRNVALNISTQLTEILVPNGTDWKKKSNYFLDGYEMFTGSTLLPNFVNTNVNIDRANTLTDYGYFSNLPPKPSINNYIKLISGWKESVVYIKDSEGVWKESEVYI